MLRLHVNSRFFSDSTRKRLYLQCLNRNFGDVLSEIRKIPTQEMDYNFLQVYLSRSCQWAHVESIDYIWYKYVMRNHVLVIKPQTLCEMSNVALSADKSFMPEQIYLYFNKFYNTSRSTKDDSFLQWQYELLRVKVESFSKSTGIKTSFTEKWKVFLEDMDNVVPLNTNFCFRDFSYLTKSLLDDTSNESLMKILFSENKLQVKNPSTLPLLLNIILLQPSFAKSFKIDLFERFYQNHHLLPYDDTMLILFKLFENDGYQLNHLIDIVKRLGNGKLKLSPLASKLFIKGIINTDYYYKIREFPSLLEQHDEFIPILKNKELRVDRINT